MNIEEFRQHCLSVEGATESTPFLSHDMLVFKIMDKMFAMASLYPREGIFWADLKCDPDYSASLREHYQGIGPGHVKSTMLWHRIVLESDVPDCLIADLIRHSAEQVVRGMTKAKRAEYERMRTCNARTPVKPLEDMTHEELWQLFPVMLTHYDPRWPGLYRTEKAAVESAVGKGNIVRINHIGSTAVPGLTAKPTIDILLEIDPLTDLANLRRALCGEGYIFNAQPGNPPPHMMFMKGYTPIGFVGQAFHLHVRYPGDWDEILFRDYLIAHPDAAAQYAELKLALAEKFRHDRDGYTAAKGDFIKNITAQAHRERPSRK